MEAHDDAISCIIYLPKSVMFIRYFVYVFLEMYNISFLGLFD